MAKLETSILGKTAPSHSCAGQQQSLARLQHVIDEQTQLIQPLTMLNSRLELLLAQTQLQPASTTDVVMTDAKVWHLTLPAVKLQSP